MRPKAGVIPSKRADSLTLGRKDDVLQHACARGSPSQWWENAMLENSLASASALELYSMAKKEMQTLSQISVSSVEDVSLSVEGDRGGSDRDTAANVERAASAMRLRDAAMMYHGEQAILLAAHASSRAAAVKDRLLRAKCFLEMAHALDATEDLAQAIIYAERAGKMFESLGLDSGVVSAGLHVMLLCCEMQDLDKAEVTAMKVEGMRASTPGVRQQLGDYLETIRAPLSMGCISLWTEPTVGRAKLGWMLNSPHMGSRFYAYICMYVFIYFFPRRGSARCQCALVLPCSLLPQYSLPFL